MTWEGYNYEDAVLINEKIVRDDVYTSIHVVEHEVEARDTKLGPEEKQEIFLTLVRMLFVTLTKTVLSVLAPRFIQAIFLSAKLHPVKAHRC